VRECTHFYCLPLLLFHKLIMYYDVLETLKLVLSFSYINTKLATCRSWILMLREFQASSLTILRYWSDFLMFGSNYAILAFQSSWM
jgi:hypothetical protein